MTFSEVRRCPLPRLTLAPHRENHGRMIAVSDAVAKMQTLSDERAARVVSMIEDLAELEARENAEDLAAAQAALARIAAGEQPVPWATVQTELDARIAELEADEAAHALPSHV